ncbi:MAG: DUF192 domain-containing protein [Anaerolineales bacterium]|nr:DUF192 domain-containing protein [Anaerolineales bacterium]
MKNTSIVNHSHPLESPITAGYCDAYLCRLKGLLFRCSIPDDWGLVMVQPNESKMDAGIHMLGMKFDIAVVWINKEMEVVDVRLAKKWVSFLFPQKPAKYVLEVSTTHMNDFFIGDKVSFE